MACGNEKRLPAGSLFSQFKPCLAVGDVHGNFEAKTHFGVLGLGPHDLYPLERMNGGVYETDPAIMKIQPAKEQRKTRKSHS
jgi:hypothetical protein